MGLARVAGEPIRHLNINTAVPVSLTLQYNKDMKCLIQLLKNLQFFQIKVKGVTLECFSNCFLLIRC